MIREKFVVEVENDIPFTDSEILQIKNFISSRLHGYSAQSPTCLKSSMYLRYELHPSRLRNKKLDELGI